jgi:hypothetical protein
MATWALGLSSVDCSSCQGCGRRFVQNASLLFSPECQPQYMCDSGKRQDLTPISQLPGMWKAFCPELVTSFFSRVSTTVHVRFRQKARPDPNLRDPNLLALPATPSLCRIRKSAANGRIIFIWRIWWRVYSVAGCFDIADDFKLFAALIYCSLLKSSSVSKNGFSCAILIISSHFSMVA